MLSCRLFTSLPPTSTRTRTGGSEVFCSKTGEMLCFTNAFVLKSHCKTKIWYQESGSHQKPQNLGLSTLKPMQGREAANTESLPAANATGKTSVVQLINSRLTEGHCMTCFPMDEAIFTVVLQMGLLTRIY